MKIIFYIDQILSMSDCDRLDRKILIVATNFLSEVKWMDMDNALSDIQPTDAHP